MPITTTMSGGEYRQGNAPVGNEPARSCRCERGNITPTELEAVQRIGADLLRLTEDELAAHLASAALTEICHDSENQGQ